MAGGFSESDEVAVGRFDAFYTPVLDFTTDNDKLITALKSLDLATVSVRRRLSGQTGARASNGSASRPGAPSAAQTSDRP